MSVSKTDSMGKVEYYLDNLAPGKQVVLSDLFLRDYTCPAMCGGCCYKFSLDYVAGSDRWQAFKEKYPEQVPRFAERTINSMKVYTDWQEDNDSRWCRNLRLSDGRCMIHEANPFTCEFELIKIIHNRRTNKTHVMKKLYGRGWQYRRVDGGVGALCEMIPFDPVRKIVKLSRDIELLEELQMMADKMMRKTNLKPIISKLKNIVQSWT